MAKICFVIYFCCMPFALIRRIKRGQSIDIWPIDCHFLFIFYAYLFSGGFALGANLFDKRIDIGGFKAVNAL